MHRSAQEREVTLLVLQQARSSPQLPACRHELQQVLESWPEPGQAGQLPAAAAVQASSAREQQHGAAAGSVLDQRSCVVLVHTSAASERTAGAVAKQLLPELRRRGIRAQEHRVQAAAVRLQLGLGTPAASALGAKGGAAGGEEESSQEVWELLQDVAAALASCTAGGGPPAVAAGPGFQQASSASYQQGAAEGTSSSQGERGAAEEEDGPVGSDDDASSSSNSSSAWGWSWDEEELSSLEEAPAATTSSSGASGEGSTAAQMDMLAPSPAAAARASREGHAILPSSTSETSRSTQLLAAVQQHAAPPVPACMSLTLAYMHHHDQAGISSNSLPAQQVAAAALGRLAQDGSVWPAHAVLVEQQEEEDAGDGSPWLQAAASCTWASSAAWLTCRLSKGAAALLTLELLLPGGQQQQQQQQQQQRAIYYQLQVPADTVRKAVVYAAGAVLAAAGGQEDAGRGSFSSSLLLLQLHHPGRLFQEEQRLTAASVQPGAEAQLAAALGSSDVLLVQLAGGERGDAAQQAKMLGVLLQLQQHGIPVELACQPLQLQPLPPSQQPLLMPELLEQEAAGRLGCHHELPELGFAASYAAHMISSRFGSRAAAAALAAVQHLLQLPQPNSDAMSEPQQQVAAEAALAVLWQEMVGLSERPGRLAVAGQACLLATLHNVCSSASRRLAGSSSCASSSSRQPLLRSDALVHVRQAVVTPSRVLLGPPLAVRPNLLLLKALEQAGACLGQPCDSAASRGVLECFAIASFRWALRAAPGGIMCGTQPLR